MRKEFPILRRDERIRRVARQIIKCHPVRLARADFQRYRRCIDINLKIVILQELEITARIIFQSLNHRQVEINRKRKRIEIRLIIRQRQLQRIRPRQLIARQCRRKPFRQRRNERTAFPRALQIEPHLMIRLLIRPSHSHSRRRKLKPDLPKPPLGTIHTERFFRQIDQRACLDFPADPPEDILRDHLRIQRAIRH